MATRLTLLLTGSVLRSTFGALALSLVFVTSAAHAQDGGADDPAGMEDTIGAGTTSGVAVDADGVVRRLTVSDHTGMLARERAHQAVARIGADVAQPNTLRKVSLTRLMHQVKQAIAEGHGPDEAMQHLAGLTRIQYVFYYPETKDIVLAGPSEGWFEDEAGRVIGLESGQPVLELQDLVVAMRTFAPGKKSNPVVYCSIDATQEGLQRMQQFLSQIGQYGTSFDEQFIVEGLRENLGLQTVTLGGVPASTHMAQVLVEADYRMKLIGIGLEVPPARIESYLSIASYATIAKNAMSRWWFVPDYQRIKMSEDGLAAELVGSGVKLVGEDEIVAADGTRQQTGTQNRASRKFTEMFTRQYTELAARAPVYGQLRNCVDLLVAAALLQQHDFYGKAGLELGVLGDESVYPVETYNAPKQIASAANYMWKGRHLATPVGGGVQIQAREALSKENLIADEKGELAAARDGVNLADLPADKWWWD